MNFRICGKYSLINEEWGSVDPLKGEIESDASSLLPEEGDGTFKVGIQNA